MESVESRDSLQVTAYNSQDSLVEVTTITIRENENGDTLKVTQVTDRLRVHSLNTKRDVEVKIVEKKDTVYVAVRDSVSSSWTSQATKSMTTFQNSGSLLSKAAWPSATKQKNSFVSSLKWIFAILCASIGLIIVIRLVCYHR